MKLVVLFVVTVLSCPAQDIIVKLSGKGPKSSAAVASINYKNAQVNYTIGNGDIDGFGTATVPITISSKTGQLPAALQFDVSWTATDISGVTMLLGPASAAANKTLTCNAQSATVIRCIIVGGVTGILDGVVATASFQTIMTSQSTTTVALLGLVTASIGGKSIKTVLLAGGGVITMPALLATVSCSDPDIWELLTVTCTATLNKPAPVGGVSVTVTSDSTLVTVPATVTIAAGTTSANFTALGN